MGQSSMSILNKTGYSMFWNSMWDNKSSYTRYLKEDMFLKSFFSLSFNDSLSINTLCLKKSNIMDYKNYYIVVDTKKNNLHKYLFNNNKMDYYSTKIWILRFQKWIILYSFIYILNFNKNKINSDFIYKNSIFYSFTFYSKVNKKINFQYLINKKKSKTKKF